LQVEAFDFDLPDELIALRPAIPRDAARMLVVDGGEGVFDDRILRDLPALLTAGDALVFNDTKVIPAQFSGLRLRGDAEAVISLTLVKRLSDRIWRTFAKPAKRLKPGDRLYLGATDRASVPGALAATVESRGEGGMITIAFDLAGESLDRAIAEKGSMPLPPYISARRPPDDQDRRDYQTVFAAEQGAVAAPTAGLHFTEELLQTLDQAGISRHTVTLHVGPGTFLPVKTIRIKDHVMHKEAGVIAPATAEALNEVKARGGRIVAVGTTVLRLLESAADQAGRLMPFSGETGIFITPGYRFRCVDRLLTNFHLPRSTLFMLVAAFSGLALMQKAYAHAVAQGYHFYSYGDACLLSPDRASR
jgi:S-adenosylmethionine:tRNA ribosyltransferase-isomerase